MSNFNYVTKRVFLPARGRSLFSAGAILLTACLWTGCNDSALMDPASQSKDNAAESARAKETKQKSGTLIPVDGPVKIPKDTTVKIPVDGPVGIPEGTPVKTPVQIPVDIPVKIPEKNPVTIPVEPPRKFPVADSIVRIPENVPPVYYGTDSMTFMPGTRIPMGECSTIAGNSCGVNGKTYESACAALRAGIEIAHAGACTP